MKEKLKIIPAINGCKNCYYEHTPFRGGICNKKCIINGKNYIYIIDK